MVHVAHDGDHRGPGFGLSGLLGLNGQKVLLHHTGPLHLKPEFRGYQHRGLVINVVIDVGHHPHLQQLLDNFPGFDAHAFGQLAYGDGFSHFDPAFDGLGDGEFALGDLFNGLAHAFSAAMAGLPFGQAIKVGPFPDFPFFHGLGPVRRCGFRALDFLFGFGLFLFFSGRFSRRGQFNSGPRGKIRPLFPRGDGGRGSRRGRFRRRFRGETDDPGGNLFLSDFAFLPL